MTATRSTSHGNSAVTRSDRILVLVPHEPHLDPRVGWVTDLCRSVGRTDVVGASSSADGVARELDGNVFVERLNINENAGTVALMVAATATGLAALMSGVAGRTGAASGTPRAVGAIACHTARVAQVGARAAELNAMVSALTTRALATSVVPRVVICHDLYALIAGVALKRRTGSPLVYDSHEFWPEADLQAKPWEQSATRKLEQRFIRSADVVVTVTPQLADLLERTYGIRGVLSVPNATPRTDAPPADDRRDRPVVRFLLQGGVAPGRGIDDLLESWRIVESPSALLEIRCPPNPYVDTLRTRFADLVEKRRVAFRDPVRESELVAAAAQSDVGVIPYGGSSLNHRYACPNKLSQYMAAGLAVVSNDLPFVADVLRRHDAGLTYDAAEPRALGRVVDRLTKDPLLLERLRANSFRAAQNEFNWERVSEPYKHAIEELYTRHAVA